MVDDDIVVEKWGPGLADDRRDGTFLSGTLYRAYTRTTPSWSIREKHDNFPVVALLHGEYAQDVRHGPVTVTVTHSHRDGYFPFRDSLYADELPLDRFTLMLQAAQASPMRHCVKVPVVVVDAREAHRAEHERLAAEEDPGQVRLRNWRGPLSGYEALTITESARLQNPLLSGSAVVVLAEPEAEVSFDEESWTVRDGRSGLGLRVRREGDRDYYYDAGTVLRGGAPAGRAGATAQPAPAPVREWRTPRSRGRRGHPGRPDRLLPRLTIRPRG